MMESHRQSQYHPILEDGPSYLSQERLHRKEDVDPLAHPDPGQYESSNTYAPPSSDQRPMDDVGLADKDQPTRQGLAFIPQPKRLSKKWQQRLYWIIPLGIVVIVLAVLFEVYKSSFERWVSPLTDWLRKRESWSWVIPVSILFILSFPPLFGHELVQLIVGLTYPLGVAIGIACAGAILGEAGCFIVFKFFATSWVEKKIETKVRWAAISRVAQEAGFRGVLVIRYSIVPPHLANPLFSCTGMKFWVYMTTVILSLPKSIVFVALGSPNAKGKKAATWGKVAAIVVIVMVTVAASRWIRTKMAVATEQIEAERGIVHEEETGDEEFGMLHSDLNATGANDTSYRGVSNSAQHTYEEAPGPRS